jgi:hypothetical protein
VNAEEGEQKPGKDEWGVEGPKAKRGGKRERRRNRVRRRREVEVVGTGGERNPQTMGLVEADNTSTRPHKSPAGAGGWRARRSATAREDASGDGQHV